MRSEHPLIRLPDPSTSGLKDVQYIHHIHQVKELDNPNSGG